MSSRGLPPLLSLVEFEPLADSSEHDSTRQRSANRGDPSRFKQCVEQLATEYLSGQTLFILSATLRGPFHSDWVNPWATEPRPGIEDGFCNRQGRLGRGDVSRRGSKRLKTSAPSSLVDCPLLPEHEHDSNKLSIVSLPAATVSEGDTHHTLNKRSNIENATILHSSIRFTPVNQQLIRETPSPDNPRAMQVTFGCERHLPLPFTSIQPAELEHPPLKEPQSVKDQIVEHALRSTSDPKTRCCSDCGTASAKTWRKGPRGPGTLCNACGQRRLRKKKKEMAPKLSTFSSKTSTKPRSSKVIWAKEKRSALNDGTNMDARTPFQHTSLPDHVLSARTLPLRMRCSSQPEPSNDTASRAQPMQRVRSWPEATKRPKPCHSEVMELLFPGGLIKDAFRRHGHLIDLMQNHAMARLSDILSLDSTTLKSETDVSANAITKTRSRRKARAMTFDTPVITHASKKARHSPRRVSKHSEFDNDAAVDTDLHTQEKPESPFISTQAAMIEAHQALVDGLDSPLKSGSPRAEGPRLALQDKTNVSANVSPAKCVNEIKLLPAATFVDENASPSMNTQALFDAHFPYSLTSSPAPASTSPNNPKQDSKKRASFASEPVLLNSLAKTPSSMSSGSRVSKTGSCSSLRKSALKKSSSQAANSLDSSTNSDSPHKILTPTGVFSAFAVPDASGNCEAGDINEEIVDSFCQDANSLLRSSTSP